MSGPADDGFARVGSTRGLRPGRGRAFDLDGTAVAVFRLADGWAAIGDTCPHMGTSLADGPVEDGVVECPWHHWRYDVTTGKSAARDWACVDVYEIRVHDGRVWLKAPPPRIDERASAESTEEEDDGWMRADPEQFFKKPRS